MKLRHILTSLLIATAGYLSMSVASAQHVQILSATSFCGSGLPGIVECPAYNGLREWPGTAAVVDVWYKVKSHNSTYPSGSYDGSALCRPPMSFAAECSMVSISSSPTATRARPEPAPAPATMSTRTYLGIEATDAVAAACVSFSYSELSAITGYVYAVEVAAELVGEGYSQCVTWSWDSTDDCTGTAYGRGNPKVPSGDKLIFDYAESKKVCIVPDPISPPADTDWTLTLGLSN